VLAGLATVRQAKAASWSDITAFVQSLTTATTSTTSPTTTAAAAATATSSSSSEWPLIVIKPLRGCASGDVYLCSTETEAKAALDTIIGTPLYATPGAVNEVQYAYY
jgi:hypothetical protein